MADCALLVVDNLRIVRAKHKYVLCKAQSVNSDFAPNTNIIIIIKILFLLHNYRIARNF